MIPSFVDILAGVLTTGVFVAFLVPHFIRKPEGETFELPDSEDLLLKEFHAKGFLLPGEISTVKGKERPRFVIHKRPHYWEKVYYGYSSDWT